MKRVLVFSLAYHPFVGGAELALEEILGRMNPQDYHFDIVTLRFNPTFPKKEEKGNVTIHRIGFTADIWHVSERSLPWQIRFSKFLFPVLSFLKASVLHRKNAYAFIWAMMANQAGFGTLFFKYANPDIPYLLELQDGNTLEEVKKRRPLLRMIWPFYRQIYLKADMIKVISSFIKGLVSEIGYEKRLVVIPNAVDTRRFSEPISEEALLFLKEALGKRMGDVFLFTASRLVLSRGVEDVIRALRHLPENVKFLIAGEGDDKEKLAAIAQEEGVSVRVKFVGHIEHNNLPIYFKISDIFVRPSLVEGFGTAFIEAFAAGLPVVATPVGGIPDFLSDPDRSPDTEPTGLFCNVHDPESVARAVKKYMEDPVLTARIVKNAKELAVQKYDWNLIANDMREKVFAPLMKGRG